VHGHPYRVEDRPLRVQCRCCRVRSLPRRCGNRFAITQATHEEVDLPDCRLTGIELMDRATPAR